jgi:polar amino acid transport system substrate-binding protein
MGKFAAFLLVLVFLVSDAHAKNLVFAVDNRNWYPFTYIQDDKATGMHVDIAVKAMESLGHKVKIVFYPRKRCFVAAKYGKVDGVVSVVYHASLNNILEFPEDANSAAESQWRLMQVDHVIASYSPLYEYSGDIYSLPQPVRLPAGDSLAYDLSRAGLMMDEAKTDEQNMKKMLRDKSGVVITTSVLAEKMNNQAEFAGRFKIQSTPLASKSCHLAFSPHTDLTKEEKNEIWDEIKKLREDYVFMLQLFSVY